MKRKPLFDLSGKRGIVERLLRYLRLARVCPVCRICCSARY
jgi:hypothetical protein